MERIVVVLIKERAFTTARMHAARNLAKVSVTDLGRDFNAAHVADERTTGAGDLVAPARLYELSTTPRACPDERHCLPFFFNNALAVLIVFATSPLAMVMTVTIRTRHGTAAGLRTREALGLTALGVDAAFGTAEELYCC